MFAFLSTADMLPTSENVSFRPQSENLGYVKQKARQILERYEKGRCQVDVVLAGTDLTHRATYEPGHSLVWEDFTERVAASRRKRKTR
jgi:hypothetical protein